MNWRLSQRIFELAAVGFMIAGLFLMWERKDPQHFIIYLGFGLLATGKMIETFHIHDPNMKIVKITAILCIYLLALLNVFFGIRTIVYIMIPLGLYYLLHYRLMFQQNRS